MARKQTKRTAAQRIARARSALVVFQPFYGTLLLNLPATADKSIGTAAVDGSKMYYNPDFIDGLADDELLFVLSHEAAHCANLHHTRRKDRNPETWNVAADYVINMDLTLAQIGRMPKGGLLDHAYRGMSTEDVYASLTQQAQQKKQQQSGGAGEGQDGQKQGGGSGEGDQSQKGSSGDAKASEGQAQAGQGSADGNGGEGQGPGEGESEGGEGKGQGGAGGKPGASSDQGGCGGVIDAAASPAEIAEQEAQWQTVTRQAIAVATRAAGKMPAHLERLVGELNKAPANWREILRRFIDQSSTSDFSWQRPDRRFGGADFILPGTVSDGINHIVIAVDTSGSINDVALSHFRAEVQSILDEGAVDKITVVHCDARINGVAEFTAGERVVMKPMGGGGTSYKPVWEWLKTFHDAADAAAIVYFTDLEPNDGFGEEPALPVLWAAYGDPRYLRHAIERVTFGEVIEVRD